MIEDDSDYNTLIFSNHATPMPYRDFDTLAVHAGREDLTELGVHALPIDLSTTYPFTNLDSATADFDALVAGEASADNPIYARLLNPTF